MLSGSIRTFIRHTGSSLAIKSRKCSSLFTELDVNHMRKRDPAPYFFDKEVQKLLTSVTRARDEVVFRDRKDGKRRAPPQYTFMTEEELQASLKAAHAKAKTILQMPPVVKERTEINDTLETEPALEGYDKHNYVFTDITFGIKDRDRIITVREPSGVLRLARWNERHRMNCIYFGITGRELTVPNMFREDLLESVLEREEYVFILDRACIQFEPDDPDYQKIVTEVYKRVNNRKHYEKLRSTRHFGPMAFYLVWNKIMDDLVVDVLEDGRIDEAVALIQLFCKIHLSDIKKQQQASTDTDNDLHLIEYYCNNHAHKKQMIADGLKTCLRKKQEKEKLFANINLAHGRTEPNTTTTNAA